MLFEDEGNDSGSLCCQCLAKQAASLADFVFTMPVHLERRRQWDLARESLHILIQGALLIAQFIVESISGCYCSCRL